LIWKLANQTDAITECVKKRVAPAARNEGSGVLVDGFVRLGEEAQSLTGRRSGKFFDGNEERDITASLLLQEREMVDLGKLFGGILLHIHPVSHAGTPGEGLLPRKEAALVPEC